MVNNRSGTPKRKAVIYARVSTRDQAVINQTPELLRLAEARGLEVVETIEETASAAKQRPGLDRVMQLAHRGKVQAVIVWALDRLGRNMLGNLDTVLTLDKLGVQVISAQESWLEVDGPARSLLIAVIGWVAQEERSRIRERTRLGVERARRSGKRIGRPPAEIDLDKALLLRKRGLSIRQVAKRLGIGVSTLHRAYQKFDAGFGGSGVVPKVARKA